MCVCESVCLCMFVCMYVCIYVFLYVCMHVHMYVRIRVTVTSHLVGYSAIRGFEHFSARMSVLKRRVIESAGQSLGGRIAHVHVHVHVEVGA